MKIVIALSGRACRMQIRAGSQSGTANASFRRRTDLELPYNWRTDLRPEEIDSGPMSRKAMNDAVALRYAF